MNKSEEVRLQSSDKAKLIRDFRYVIESDLNTWFKRNFLWTFINNWINKINNDYEHNKIWSRAAIEQKIYNMQVHVDSDQHIKDCKKFNHEHTVPKVFFEDIFIDGPLLKADPLRKIRHKKRILQAYDFYVTLRNQSINIDYNEFLSEFFNKFISIVTLLKGEHSVLTSQSKMPDSFFFTHDIWSRYMGWGKDFIECKICKKKKFECLIEPIELYEVNFSKETLYHIEWNQMSLHQLKKSQIIKGPIYNSSNF